MPWLAPPDAPSWIGLDIGGANLKIADGRGRAVSTPFPLWQEPERLSGALCDLLSAFGTSGATNGALGMALTMTGELADCYATKAEGVRSIVEAALAATPTPTIRVATVDDRWLPPAEAIATPHTVAAANWRVAARLVALASGAEIALWIDTGSTTVDVIPLTKGRCGARGINDTERLMNGELIYTGVRRTPVCAVVDALPYRGQSCPVAAEWFATTADAWLLLGEIEADEEDTGTADGRPLTPPAARDRLARCVGADRETFDEADALAAARCIAATQEALVAAAIERQSPVPHRVYVSGEGEFLARRAQRRLGWRTPVERISDHVGDPAAACFPAHAAAVLAAAELGWAELRSVHG
ncbi:hypothetical protein Pla108_31710 [Botrimarina colliarenosi]|uniref:Hydantoinase A/oxoprolinase domain-containing protein n=1 Tax=Botrimarina colliarenosi TaxID=2528001 RepID=A0A5C6A968_9BACT|nr:hydantoinase/oxoprolinase family protein [Botrimarina colliarenosi]TWT96089.1 hypothetical protein Pla108_31710 [Botrimarina colliarenosi]